MTTSQYTPPKHETSATAVDRDLHVRVSPRSLMVVLLIVALLLALAHLVFSLNALYLGLDFPGATLLYVLFDVCGEVTVPTWYSASLLLAGIARGVQRLAGPFVFHWYGLAAIVLLLSIDEAADAHGAVSYKLQSTVDLGGALSYPWVILGAIASLIFGLIYFRFLLHLPSATRNRIILAGCIVIGGALGMEVIEAVYDSSFDHEAPYLFMVAIEELVEMTGVIILFTTLIAYAGTLSRGFRVVIERQSTWTGSL